MKQQERKGVFAQQVRSPTNVLTNNSTRGLRKGGIDS